MTAAPRRDAALLVCGVSALSIPFTVTHIIEDFAYGVPARFGLDLLPAAVLVSGIYTLQLLAAIAAARGSRAGLVANAALGAAWLLAVVLDHLGEILFADPYREGLISKLLEVAIVVVAVVWLIVSVMAARSHGQATAR